MSFLGHIEDLSIPEVLQTLGRGLHSGVLTLSGDGGKSRILVNEGRVVAANSTKTPRLGHILVRKGLITLAQLKEMIQRQKDTGGSVSMGTLLLESGFITGERLEAEILDQILTVFGDVFTWGRGIFHFHKNLDVARCFLLREGFTVEYLLLEFMKSRDEDDDLARILRPPFEPGHASCGVPAGGA